MRRWPEAGELLAFMLSRPMLTPQGRAVALMLLANVLSRFGRFDDAIAVESHLLETLSLDPMTSHALKLGRAMAMLREDRLVDADSAITDLRRSAGRLNLPRENSDDDLSPIASHARSHQSGGLWLLELYRDVKTGHPAEAVAAFDAKVDAMREQLGHRLADAYALVAKARDLLGQSDAAARDYERATLLSPSAELHRRYPEIASLASKYAPAPFPPALPAEAA